VRAGCRKLLAERFLSLQIDDQPELCSLHDRQCRGLGGVQDLSALLACREPARSHISKPRPFRSPPSIRIYIASESGSATRTRHMPNRARQTIQSPQPCAGVSDCPARLSPCHPIHAVNRWHTARRVGRSIPPRLDAKHAGDFA
jgi:hypothetical protein